MPLLRRRLAAQQLHEKGADVRLIFIHPNFAQQHAILTEFLPGGAYVRLSGNALSKEDVQRQIAEALEAQGARLDSVETLVIDEADRASMQEFTVLIRDVLGQMPSGRIVVLSRALPSGLLADSHLRQQTHFVPARDKMMLWDYAQHNNGSNALLEVRALGLGRVQLNGQPVENWDGMLPRSLFFYLVDRGMVRRAEIFETFWPDLSVREATNVFHVTKRKVSEVLGIDLTVYWSGFYHISPKISLSYDVSLFTEMAQDSAIAPDEEAVGLLEQAVSLYRGDFLTSLESDWVVQRRQDLLQAYGEALISLAKIYERTNEPHRALGLYLRATTTNLHREDLAASIMRLFRELNQPQEALTVYERLEKELRQALNVAPGKQVRELADSIRNEIAH
jgi:DNA-binding SARP family transcriptional activator